MTDNRSTKSDAQFRRDIYRRMIKVERLIMKASDCLAMAREQMGANYLVLGERWDAAIERRRTRT